MGKSQKSETSYQFTPAEAAAYLRHLADQLDQAKVDMEQAEFELIDQVKIKESIKDKPGKRSIKIKVKLAGAGPSETEPEPEEVAEPGPEAVDGEAGPIEEALPKPAAKPKKASYKNLKKKMADGFKALKSTVRQGEIPQAALVEGFLEQCRRMVTYPGKGEPYYEEFGKAADELARGAAAEDLTVIGASLEELGRLRKNCHQRFK